MAKEDLIDDRVSTSQIQKAVDALHTYESKKQKEREETELISGKEPNIWLNVAVKQVAVKSKIKPIKIPIDHPLVDPRTTSICLITKDPQREYKDLLETHNIKFISRIVGISKLKGKFKAFEARRLLLKENGLFLADDRVIPLLPKLLGSKWFEAKKQPIPVCLTRKDLKSELERAISSTYMNQNNGTCTSIKIGTLTHKPTQVVSNIVKAIPTIATHIPGGWDNIQSFFIKTNTSISLPIWSCSLDDRWVGLMKEDKEAAQGKGKGKEKGEAKSGGKGKKRPVVEENSGSEGDEESEDEEEEVQQHPKKKMKSVSGKTTNVPISTTKPKKPHHHESTDLHLKPKKHATTSTPEAQSPLTKPQKHRSRNQIPVTTVAAAAQLTKAKAQTQALTKGELKQKRSSNAGLMEKKKEKIVNKKKIGSGVNGKSAKAKVLGKKALLT